MSDATAPVEGETETAETTSSANKDETNRIVGERLKRQMESLTKKYGNLDELAAKAKRVDEIEESQKTEIQKATERADAAERALQQKSSEALRFAVIAKHAIPAEYQDFVSGADEDELEAKAQKVLSLIPSTTGDQSQVRELFIPGEGRSPANPAAGDPAQQFADALRRASSR